MFALEYDFCDFVLERVDDVKNSGEFWEETVEVSFGLILFVLGPEKWVVLGFEFVDFGDYSIRPFLVIFDLVDVSMNILPKAPLAEIAILLTFHLWAIVPGFFLMKQTLLFYPPTLVS
jgi:hypothetical protein